MNGMGQSGFIAAAVASPIDKALDTRPFSHAGTKQGHRQRAEPDLALIHWELKSKQVTLQSTHPT